MKNFKKENILIYSILFFVLSACKTISYKKDNIIINELVILCDIKYGEELCSNGISIPDFKKHYTIINDRQIFENDFQYDSIAETNVFSGNYKPISLITLINDYDYKDDLESEQSLIENGYVIKYEAGIYNDTAFIPIKTISYKKGYISEEFKIVNIKDSVLYKTNFKKGKGYWKDYYYKQNRLREEGNVKNNCKVGLWKYYNLSGTIDSTKTYTLNDSVDLRFPFNLYNEIEARAIIK